MLFIVIGVLDSNPNHIYRVIHQWKRVTPLLALTAGLLGCTSLMRHGLSAVTGGIDTHFEPEPGVDVPTTHFFPDLRHFESLDRVPWPYQKVGVITVANFQSEKNSP